MFELSVPVQNKANQKTDHRYRKTDENREHIKTDPLQWICFQYAIDLIIVLYMFCSSSFCSSFSQFESSIR